MMVDKDEYSTHSLEEEFSSFWFANAMKFIRFSDEDTTVCHCAVNNGVCGECLRDASREYYFIQVFEILNRESLKIDAISENLG